MKFLVKGFVSDLNQLWDSFIDSARNGLFMHKRAYMDYHSERFDDCSALVYNEKDRLLAVFPASSHGEQVASHGGLTYGGLVLSNEASQADVLEILRCLIEHYTSCRYRKILYKAIPPAFHRSLSQDDLYALFRCGGKLVRRDASTIITMDKRPALSKGRKWIIKKGQTSGLALNVTSNPADFSSLLSDVLSRHNAKPVHTADELKLLMNRFPENISLHEARLDGRLLAGVWLFDFGHIVHTQYLANSDEGRQVGALDYLVSEIIDQHKSNRKFFSFGISTEQAGTVLNEGLIRFKESYGGFTQTHDFYEIELS